MSVNDSDDEMEVSLADLLVPGHHTDTSFIANQGFQLPPSTGVITRSQRAAVTTAENSQQSFLAGGGPAPQNSDAILASTLSNLVQLPGSIGSALPFQPSTYSLTGI